MPQEALLDATATDEAGQMMADLTRAINRQILPRYQTSIVLIERPSQGDFPFRWQNINQVFNAHTFNYVSARVSPSRQPGVAQLSSAGSFPNAYSQVLQGLYYALGSQDLALLSAAQANADAAQLTIVQTYIATFGPITVQDRASAGVANNLDYVVGYVVGSVWSGRGRLAPLTYMEMQKAEDLRALLPDRPASSEPVIVAIEHYLALMQPVLRLMDQERQGAWMLHQLRLHTEAPTTLNGGMQTYNPNTGAVSSGFQLAYRLGITPQELQTALSNDEQALKVSITLSAGTARVADGPPRAAPAALTLITENGAKTALRSITGASVGGVERMTITYPGYTWVPVAAEAWQQATNMGWFSGDPIAQAMANGQDDVTGFRLLDAPPFNMGDLPNGGTFGMIIGLLISQAPEIEVTTQPPPQGALLAPAMPGKGEPLTSIRLFDALELTPFAASGYQVLPMPDVDGRQVFKLQQASAATPPSLFSAAVPGDTAHVIGGSFYFPGTGS